MCVVPCISSWMSVGIPPSTAALVCVLTLVGSVARHGPWPNLGERMYPRGCMRPAGADKTFMVLLHQVFG